MDKILHAHNTILAQILLNDLIVRERDALLVHLAVAALVDEVADGLEGGVAVGDVRLDDLEHFRGGFGEADEDAVINLEEAEELEDFAGFGGDLIDTEILMLTVLVGRAEEEHAYPLIRMTKTSLGSAGT